MIRYHSQNEKEKYPFGWDPKMNDLEGEIVTISDISASLTKLCYQVRYGYCESYFDESSLRLVSYDQF